MFYRLTFSPLPKVFRLFFSGAFTLWSFCSLLFIPRHAPPSDQWPTCTRRRIPLPPKTRTHCHQQNHNYQFSLVSIRDINLWPDQQPPLCWIRLNQRTILSLNGPGIHVHLRIYIASFVNSHYEMFDPHGNANGYNWRLVPRHDEFVQQYFTTNIKDEVVRSNVMKDVPVPDHEVIDSDWTDHLGRRAEVVKSKDSGLARVQPNTLSVLGPMGLLWRNSCLDWEQRVVVNVFVVSQLKVRAQTNGTDLVLMFIDMRKAYDSGWREGL